MLPMYDKLHIILAVSTQKPLHAGTHLMLACIAQVAARELRTVAQGGSNKLVAQQITVWAQWTNQVDAEELQVCSTPLPCVCC